MNFVEELAKQFCVGENERFYIKDDGGNISNYLFHLDFKLGLLSDSGEQFNEQLGKLFLGKLSIVKEPFRPKCGDRYYHYNTDMSIDSDIWLDVLYDYGMLALENVFRSPEEAQKNKDILLGNLRELKVDNVVHEKLL